MRRIRVLVHNDKERDNVLREFEREGMKWNEGQSAMKYKPKKDYPYYIYRDEVLFVGAEYTGSWIGVFKDVPASTFPEFDKDVITIASDGKTVTAEMGDKKGVAKCSPDDEFSLRTGAKLALDRMFGLQVGDEVRVKEIFMVHEWAKDFMLEHCSKEMCARFAYGKTPNMHETLTIVGVYLHRGLQWAVCERKGLARELFAINVKGLEKID